MPYPPGHSDEVRQKIIRSARKLFNLRGFEHVTVNQIMAAAGLTRGGFYSYFKSKEDLYVEVLPGAAPRPRAKGVLLLAKHCPEIRIKKMD